MLRLSRCRCNTYITHSLAVAPITAIRSTTRWWSDPERMVKYKTLYFTLGIDQLPLRRTALIQNEYLRTRMCPTSPIGGDKTGYKRARAMQLNMWYRRIQYQEYFLQHLYTRHVWGLTRVYPNNYVKITGKADDGYAGYDAVPYHRYNRQPLPMPAREIYDRRV